MENSNNSIRDYVVYFIAMLILIALTSSFIIAPFYERADKIELNQKGLNQIFSVNIGETDANTIGQ